MTLGYLILLIHFSIAAKWLVFHCSIAITINFFWAKKVDLFPRIMYFYIRLVFIGQHIRTWSIGWWIVQYLTDKMRFLVGLYICDRLDSGSHNILRTKYVLQSDYTYEELPPCRVCNFMAFKEWIIHKMKKKQYRFCTNNRCY